MPLNAPKAMGAARNSEADTIPSRFIEVPRAALLAGPRREEPAEAVRQVIFITDGSVGNEDELYAMIETRLGNARLFTVGIGSDG